MSPATVARRRHGPLWLAGALALGLLLLAGVGAALVASGAALLPDPQALRDGVHIVIDGEPWTDFDVAIPGLLGGATLGLAGLLLCAALCLVLLPLGLLLGLGLGLGMMALLMGSTLLAAVVGLGLLAAVLLSPLWALALLLWLLLRPPSGRTARMRA